MTVPGGGEGTILPRLCSQPGERRPGPGAAHARSPPPARAPPPCGPGLARHGVQGRRPGGPALSRGWKVWQGAEGGRHRGWPGRGPAVCAPGMRPAPRRAGVGGDWQSGSERASPPAPVPAHRPRRTMGSPPGEDSGGRGMGPWASLRGAGSPGTPAGHRPAGGRAQRGRWSPGNSPAAARAGPDALAMCWPWPGSPVPLPMASCVGTTRPPRGQGGCQVSRASLLWRES